MSIGAARLLHRVAFLPRAVVAAGDWQAFP